MIGNRRYWKACAKQFLSGKWGIAILAMMAAPALNTIGTMAAIKLFPEIPFWHGFWEKLFCLLFLCFPW